VLVYGKDEMTPDMGWILAALALTLTVAVAMLLDERRANAERALYKELREVQAVSQGLWDSLGPDRYGELVSLYLRRGDEFARATFVIEFWDRAAEAYARRKVNRRRFMARIAPKCDGFWRDYADLIVFLAQNEPSRIAGWRRLHGAAIRQLDRNFKCIERIGPRKAA
jgi:hypothetical protein